jgi:branched-chain amino acid transport system substrate-binding protein
MGQSGSAMDEGLRVAVEMFNRKHRDHRAVLISVNDESDPAKGVAAIEKLISQNVHLVGGGFGSHIIGPASEAAHKAGVPYLTGGSLGAGLLKRGYKDFFRVVSDDAYSRAVAGFLSDIGAKSVSILHVNNDPCTVVAEGVEKLAAAKGIKVTKHAFESKTSDFKPIVNRVKLQDKPDAIAMMAYEPDYIGILSAVRVLRPEVKAVVGSWSIATAKMAKEKPELFAGVLGTSGFPLPVQFDDAEANEAAKYYRETFKKEPDHSVFIGYMLGNVMFDALKRAAAAGKLEDRAYVLEMVKKTNLQTIYGRVQFNELGDNDAWSLKLGQHHGGGSIPIVWPASAATGKLKLPAVPF